MAILVHSLALVATLLALAYLGMLAHATYRRQLRNAQLFEEERSLLRARLEQLKTPVVQVALQKGQAWSGFRKFSIEGKVLEADAICSFYLAPHDGRALPAYLPGQYLTFKLAIPGQSREITRCYSLSDGPQHTDYYRVTIKRVGPPPDGASTAPGLMSSHFHDRLQVGDIVDVKAPSGQFHLDVEHRGPVVMVGGGVGVTPMLSMLNHIASAPGNREAWFFYGVRNSADHMMKQYLKELASQHQNIHLVVCYSNPRPEDRLGEDYHYAERVSVDLFRRVLQVNNFDFYVCGPPPMMESLTRDLGEWGVPADCIHFEAFGAASVKRVAQVTHPAAVSGTAAFEVDFARSGKKLLWSGAGSLLEFAEAHGIRLESGCRAGSCGTCAIALREGQVDYLRKPDIEIEKGTCLTCISVPKGTLSIDA
ncbi:MAG TPA: 2Fe-2S iron-sulfur cluster-binding protein [Burkholderiales bacterium]|nr:2Fe-2S iron-sulfur cluster-binding protein [Burkholderiales bacterium]